MIKIEKTEVNGWEAAIRGMRNPMNSWGKSDSGFDYKINSETEPITRVVGSLYYRIGEADHELMMKLAKGGSTHAKYRRMINVTADITAPFYWWKEYDTYKVGTVANSCSTMHKIHAKEFTLDDFSHDNMTPEAIKILNEVIKRLNFDRKWFTKTKDKGHWNNMIRLLPSCYNQKRTVQLNYEVLAGIYPERKAHKLNEWHYFCHWIESLPYSELITGDAHER